MDPRSDFSEIFAQMKSGRVDESFSPLSEDETIKLEHFVTEPKTENISAVLCTGNELDDFSCGFDYGFTTNFGAMHCDYALGGKDDLRLDVLDGLLDGVDEADDIFAANSLSTSCADFLLDFEFAEKVSEIGYGLHERSSLEDHSPGTSGHSSNAVGISDSSPRTIPKPECNAETNEDRSTCVELISKDAKDVDETDDDEKPLASFIVTRNKGKNSVRGKRKKVLASIHNFSENSSDFKPGCLVSGQKVSTSSEAPYKLRALRGRPKKYMPRLKIDSDDEYTLSDSEEECQATKKIKRSGVDRRKSQRLWTHGEVMKLVDGIARFGVGRWTDIKNILFSTSSYRTPMDLRDKWRNLIRACNVQKRHRKEADGKEKEPLPNHILQQINELAVIHPYPSKIYSRTTGKVSR